MRRKHNKRRKGRRRQYLSAATADPHILYENSVQCTESTIDFIDTP